MAKLHGNMHANTCMRPLNTKRSPVIHVRDEHPGEISPLFMPAFFAWHPFSIYGVTYVRLHLTYNTRENIDTNFTDLLSGLNELVDVNTENNKSQ
jgi:hypothetical protein